MLIAALSLAFAINQSVTDPPQPEDSAMVADPFDIEAQPAPAVADESAGPAAATPAGAPPRDRRLICRRRLELGTRLRYLRVCMTAAEWETNEVHMEQQRRDINDWGAQGGGAVPR